MMSEMQTDRDWKRGCCNTDCPGLVPFNTIGTPTPGMVFNDLSSYNRIDSSIILQIVKDERPVGGGHWWLHRAIGSVRFPVGHWPTSLFTSLAKHATEAAWYGAVGYARRGDDRPAMGSGPGPGEGYNKAVYFTGISLTDNMALPDRSEPQEHTAPMVSGRKCYGLASDGDFRFYYGGPINQNR